MTTLAVEPTVHETFPINEPIWCAGCGHFSVLNALDSSLKRLGIQGKDALIVAGIGCSGTIQNHIQAYGYHALHGRALPSATGAKLANPELTVIAAGGDGDGLAIGGGHLLHTFRGNPAIAYIIMNNSTYGLTKGQASPTSQGGFRGFAAREHIDPIMLGLSMPATTFLARSYSGDGDQLERLTDAAITHANSGRGFAFLEVISPCVAYNDRYHEWPAHLIDLDKDSGYDPHDRAAAFVRMLELEAQDRVATGQLFLNEDAPRKDPTGPAQQNIDPAHNLDAYTEVLHSFQA